MKIYEVSFAAVHEVARLLTAPERVFRARGSAELIPELLSPANRYARWKIAVIP
jgi:hypothetical protein